MRVMCISLFAAAIALFAPSHGTTGDKKADKIAFETYPKGYFVKNNFTLPANPAFLVIQDKKAYDKVFGFGAVMGGKPKLVTEKLFDDNIVITVVKSGSTLWKYDVEQVTRDKTQIIVKYKAAGKESPSAKYNSPLILSVPRGDVAEVVFIENGKQAGKASLKK